MHHCFIYVFSSSPQSGFTPLFVASHGGHTEVVNTLLNSGADPNLACTVWVFIYWHVHSITTKCNILTLKYIAQIQVRMHRDMITVTYLITCSLSMSVDMLHVLHAITALA